MLLCFLHFSTFVGNFLTYLKFVIVYTENFKTLVLKLRKIQISRKIFHIHQFKELILLKCLYTTESYLQIQCDLYQNNCANGIVTEIEQIIP